MGKRFNILQNTCNRFTQVNPINETFCIVGRICGWAYVCIINIVSKKAGIKLG